MARSPAAVMVSLRIPWLRVPARVRTLAILVTIALLAGFNQTLFHDLIVLLRASRHLLNEDLGVAVQANGIGYLVTLPLGGFFAHLLGPRRVLLGAGVLLAAAACGVGLVFDARSYAILCLLLGLAAGTVPGAATTAIGLWFPPQEQARAIAGLKAAPVLGALAATVIMSARTAPWASRPLGGSWLLVSLGAGVLSIAWLVLARFCYRPRPAMPGSDAERNSSDLPAGTLWPLGVVLRGGVLMLLAFCDAYALGLGGDWLTTRLFADWHLDIADADAVTVAGLVGSLAGLLLGGVLSDAAFHQSGNAKSARQVVIGLGFLIGAGCLLPLRDVHDLPHAAIWRGVSFFFLSLPAAPLWSIALTIAPGKAGPVVGMIGLGVSLGLLASPEWLAAIAGAHGWTISFWLGIGLSTICGVGAFGLDPSLEIEKPPPKAEDGEDDAHGHGH